MRYLLLIPSTVAMLAAVFFYASGALFKWGFKGTMFFLFAGVTFQFAAIYIAGMVDHK